MRSSNPFTEENFYAWLSSHVSSSKLSDLYKIFTAIDNYCKKKKIISSSIYQIQSENEIKKIEKTIIDDRLSWVNSRGLSNKAHSVLPYYVQYIKKVQEEFQLTQTEDEERIDALVNSILKEKVARDEEAKSSNTGLGDIVTSQDRSSKHVEREEDGINSISNSVSPERAGTGPAYLVAEPQHSGEEIMSAKKADNDDVPAPDLKPIKTVQQERREYLTWLVSKGLGETTARAYINNLKQYAGWVKNHTQYEWNLMLIDDASVLTTIYGDISRDQHFRDQNPLSISLFLNAFKKYIEYRGGRIESGSENNINTPTLQDEHSAGDGTDKVDYNIDSTLEEKISIEDLLTVKGIRYRFPSKNYILVEYKAMPDQLLKEIRQSSLVSSVNLVRLYGKDHWRIHLRRKDESEKNNVEKAQNDFSKTPNKIENSQKTVSASIEQKGTPYIIKPESDYSTPSDTTVIQNKQLDPELFALLADDDMQILREELIKNNITTLKRFNAENIWVFMNRHALYNIKKRQDINSRIFSRLHSSEAKEDKEKYKLETVARTYFGSSPAEIFVKYCTNIAQRYPLKFRSLLGIKYGGLRNPIIARTDLTGNSLMMTNPVAYIPKDMTIDQVMLYGNWVCKSCGSADFPKSLVKIGEPSSYSKPKQEQKSEEAVFKGSAISGRKEVTIVSEDSTAAKNYGTEYESTNKIRIRRKSRSAASEQTYLSEITPEDIKKAEEYVLDADLEGLTAEALSIKMDLSVGAAKKVADQSIHVVQLGDKYIHDEAFVDWEDGADQLESILDKLLDRNNGYVSATQLYDFAHSDMQMFLNDNDLDDARLIYDMAQHLFEKICYHGKKLVFQSKSHISRPEAVVGSVMDLMCHFARSKGGIFREEDLIAYLESVGVKTGNLRQGLMKVYTEPIFLMYDSGEFIYSESMGISDEWFSEIRKSLKTLFNDMGDHIILRDIQPWWFMQLPLLPGGRKWTIVLLQNVLYHYKDKLDGVHTIAALSTQSMDTVHAMIVEKESEIQTFPDAVAAFFVDEGLSQTTFEAEDLRQLLINRGLIAGGELIGKMQKALANDARFAWDAEGKQVAVILS